MWAGIIAMIIAGLIGLIAIIAGVEGDKPMLIIPPMPQHSPEMTEAINEASEWTLYWLEANAEYEDEFTKLFNSYETKWSKNNRLMIRKGSTGSYTFAKRSN